MDKVFENVSLFLTAANIYSITIGNQPQHWNLDHIFYIQPHYVILQPLKPSLGFPWLHSRKKQHRSLLQCRQTTTGARTYVHQSRPGAKVTVRRWSIARRSLLDGKQKESKARNRKHTITDTDVWHKGVNNLVSKSSDPSIMLFGGSRIWMLGNKLKQKVSLYIWAQ